MVSSHSNLYQTCLIHKVTFGAFCNQTIERQCLLGPRAPILPGLTVFAHLLSSQDVSLCVDRILFWLLWGGEVGYWQSRDYMLLQFTIWRKDLVILSSPIWKTLMCSLGSHVHSLAQSLCPGVWYLTWPMRTRARGSCGWQLLELRDGGSTVFRKRGKESKQSKGKECQLYCPQTTLFSL